MQYLLLIGGDESTAKKFEEEPGCGGWSEEMTERGVLKGGFGLYPPDDATTVRVRGDQVLLSDGPFAETKDQIGGLSIIECENLDEAIEIASKHPAARFGLVEVRPIFQP
jgi:hypothetical protein